MAKISYREFGLADMSGLLGLAVGEWRVCIRDLEPLLKKYDGKQVKCYLAELEGSIVGLAVGFILPNKSLLPELIFVAEPYRGLGIGSKLMKTLEKHSGCNSSTIYYNKNMHDYFRNKGYLSSEQLEVAIKNI